ncbi:hypothetical protein ROZALSC1DRAFT_28164 [Rozella allomycis CSF55]|uniref:ATPase domain-containing protein n=1 Tax=Rozella allomycis (strain CSF55) TaxID=988480 RepID=A0A4P9YLG6_ROZAC|nr:hypothetical protein ROZALSC1DRAFT_28164 [Rozella allomycis CSF55]
MAIRVDIEPFDKTEKRDVLIRKLERNGPTLPLVGRDTQIKLISKDVLVSSQDKTMIGVLCSARGMGRTTLLKAIVDPENFGVSFNSPTLDKARAVGRLAVVDLCSHLCMMFGGCVVDGVEFKSKVCIEKKLNIQDVDNAFRQWIRLTNAAYEVNSDAKPIIILDGIKAFMQSKNGSSNTYLIEAVKQLENRCHVIAAGSRDCNLLSVTDDVNFVTFNIPLTAWSMQDIYEDGVNYLTLKNCRDQWPKSFEDFVNNRHLLSLFYQTLQVPGLVRFAIYAFIETSSIPDAFSSFENKLKKWYRDAWHAGRNYSDHEIVHILFVCASGYRVTLHDCIPGTDILVSDLAGEALLFHCRDDK